MDIDSIVSELKALTPAKQKEAFNFIVFLRSQDKGRRASNNGPQKGLVDEPFVGIWKDRTDMQDSTAWVRRARRTEWGV